MGDDDALFDRTHRVFDVPRPVWVRLATVFTPRTSSYDGVTIRDRAYGIDVSAVAAGELLGWYRLDVAGAWWGQVRFSVGSRNGRLHMELLALVPAAALSPRTEDDI